MRSLLLLLLVSVVSTMSACQSMSVNGKSEEFSTDTDVSASPAATIPSNTLTVTEEQIEEEPMVTVTSEPYTDTTPDSYRKQPTLWEDLLSAFASTDPKDKTTKHSIEVGPSASHLGPGGKYVPLVLFDYDQYFLTPHGQKTLADASDWLKNDPKSPLVIEGHCDLRGTHAYNIALGHKRAVSVKEYLRDMGIDESRLETVSYGEAKPICTHDNTLCHTINRRAFVLIQAPRPKSASTSTDSNTYAFSSIETY